MEAAERGEGAIVDVLLAEGAEPHAVVARSWTALMLASHGGHGHVVRRLLETGVDPDAISVDGVTALMIASVRGHADVVRRLLDHGADATRTRPTDAWFAYSSMPASTAKRMGGLVEFLNARGR